MEPYKKYPTNDWLGYWACTIGLCEVSYDAVYKPIELTKHSGLSDNGNLITRNTNKIGLPSKWEE